MKTNFRMQTTPINKLSASKTGPSSPPSSSKPPKLSFKDKLKKHKIKLILASILVILLAISAAFYFLIYLPSLPAKSRPAIFRPKKTALYSTLSGEKLQNPKDDNLPIFCMQIPNGQDGARPQVGLHEAKIVFEAIAEAGITRFAAVFQNPTGSAIGPIRSLRSYYYNWDKPFNCTVIHAGGSDDALAAIRGYERDLSESYDYMWRDYSGYRAPNNLFTSTELLNKFNQNHNIANSKFPAFKRLKPKKAAKIAKKQGKKQPVSNINISFGSSAGFSLSYAYDAKTNSYLRSYANGEPHLAYSCPAGQNRPKPKQNCGQPAQLAPKVVIAMKVPQSRGSDGYHEDITTTGSGQAVIFQNGTALTATWEKSTENSQIKFKNKKGKIIPLTPGQTWISAISASAGQVSY